MSDKDRRVTMTKRPDRHEVRGADAADGCYAFRPQKAPITSRLRWNLVSCVSSVLRTPTPATATSSRTAICDYGKVRPSLRQSNGLPIGRRPHQILLKILFGEMNGHWLSRSAKLADISAVDVEGTRSGITNQQSDFVMRFDLRALARIHQAIQDSLSIGGG